VIPDRLFDESDALHVPLPHVLRDYRGRSSTTEAVITETLGTALAQAADALPGVVGRRPRTPGCWPSTATRSTTGPSRSSREIR